MTAIIKVLFWLGLGGALVLFCLGMWLPSIAAGVIATACASVLR